MKCPECGSEMELIKRDTYVRIPYWHCYNCGHEEKVK